MYVYVLQMYVYVYLQKWSHLCRLKEITTDFPAKEQRQESCNRLEFGTLSYGHHRRSTQFSFFFFCLSLCNFFMTQTTSSHKNAEKHTFICVICTHTYKRAYMYAVHILKEKL